MSNNDLLPFGAVRILSVPNADKGNKNLLPKVRIFDCDINQHHFSNAQSHDFELKTSLTLVIVTTASMTFFQINAQLITTTTFPLPLFVI